MNYLVTGGAGFIGSHLTEALIADGNEVVVLDDFSTGSPTNLSRLLSEPKLKQVQGSVADKQLVESLVRDTDGVFHFAAAVGVQKILDDPIGSLKTNIDGTEIVLLSAAKHKKRVLLASTSEIYGKNSANPLTEDSDRILGSPLLSRWTYSEAKAIDEAFARVLHERESLMVQIVRFFNTVGPRQSPSYGMVIPKFFRSAILNKPLVIYGDGSQRRVFCHISDAITGVMALWKAETGYGEAFNLGGFEEITILELANRIIKLTNSKSTIEFESYNELSHLGFEDIQRRIPGTTKLQKATGWRPNKSLDYTLKDIYASFSSL